MPEMGNLGLLVAVEHCSVPRIRVWKWKQQHYLFCSTVICQYTVSEHVWSEFIITSSQVYNRKSHASGCLSRLSFI